jgi:hypothetical protein
MFRGGVANINPDERTNRTMRKHLLAVACLAALGLASQAGATTILQSQQGGLANDPTGVVNATTAAGVTTFTTNSSTAPGFIPVNLSQLAGLGGPAGVGTGFEQLVNFHSTTTASNSGGQVTQSYTGTVIFWAAISGGVGVPGSRFLQVSFTTGNFSGTAGGTGANFLATTPPDTVVFTTDNPTMAAAIAAAGPGPFTSIAIAFSNVTPNLGTTGTALNGFSAQNVVTVSITPIPEPSSVVPAGLALVAGLGGYGWRRRRAIGA